MNFCFAFKQTSNNLHTVSKYLNATKNHWQPGSQENCFVIKKWTQRKEHLLVTVIIGILNFCGKMKFSENKKATDLAQSVYYHCTEN